MATSFEAVEAADWTCLARGRSVFQEVEWYRSAPAPGALRLLLATRGGRPVAILPLFLVTAPTHYYHSPREVLCGSRERPLLQAAGTPAAVLDAAQRAPWLPALVSVSPYGYRGGAVSAGLDEEAAAALVQAVDEVGRIEGVRLSALHYLTEAEDAPLIKALLQRGGAVAIAGAECRLDLAWGAVDEYLRWLGPSRVKLRREYERAMAAGGGRWRWEAREAGPFPADVAGPAAFLFARASRQHHELEPPTSLFEHALRRWPGPRLLSWSEDARGRMRSALLVFRKEARFFPKFYGSFVRDDYFVLTFGRLVEQAMAAGVASIEYGGGSHQAKLLRGARCSWMLMGLRAYDAGLAALLERLLPEYVAAKALYFGRLAERWQLDHRPPPVPGYSLPAAVAGRSLSSRQS